MSLQLGREAHNDRTSRPLSNLKLKGRKYPDVCVYSLVAVIGVGENS